MRRLGHLLIALLVAGLAAFGMAILIAIIVGVASLSPDYYYLRETTETGLFANIQPGDLILLLISPLTGVSLEGPVETGIS